MKTSELVGRCVKARIMSWLHSGTIGAVLPVGDGHGVVLAVYHNGRYIEPEVVRVPNSPGEMWGPDGPIGHDGQPLSHNDHPEEGEEEKPDGPEAE